MNPYADTNFFSTFYLPRAEAAIADRLLERAIAEGSEPLPVTWLLRLETINSLEQSVFLGKSRSHPRITIEQAAAARATFLEDLTRAELIRSVRIQWEKLEREFEEISLRHTAKHGFRTYDILHVASAKVLNCDEFWSFDSKASKLAKLEGLRVLSANVEAQD